MLPLHERREENEQGIQKEEEEKEKKNPAVNIDDELSGSGDVSHLPSAMDEYALLPPKEPRKGPEVVYVSPGGAKGYRYPKDDKEIEALRRQKQARESIENFYTSYRDALDTNPEEFARKMETARSVGLPTDFLDNPNVYKEALKARGFIADKPAIDALSPELRGWVSRFGLMKLVRDDLENLKRTEEILKYRGETFNVTRGFRGANARTEKNLLRFKEIFGALSDADKARIQELDKIIELNSENDDAGFFDSLLYDAGDIYGQRKDQINRGLKYGATAGLLTMGTIASGGVGLLTSGAAIGGTGALGAGTTAAALTGAAFGGGATYGALESGFIAETGGFFGELMETRDENGNSIDPNVAKAAALVYGAGASLIEAAQLDKLLTVFPNAKKMLTKEGIKTLLKNKTVRDAIGTFFKDYGKDLSFETLTEIGQQGLQILLRERAKNQTNAFEGTEFEPAGAEEIVSELWETGKSSLVQFALPLLPGPGVNLLSNWNAARTARERIATFEAFSDSAKASKLRERSPEAYGALAEELTKNGPVNEAAISVELFNEYFQSVGMDPAAVAGELGVGERYAEALETGGDVVIPMSEFAAKLAGTEHFDALKDDLRLGENAMTPREAREFLNRAVEDYRREAEKSARTEEERKEQDRVRDDVKARLEHLGPKWLGKREAKAYSTLLTAGLANEARAAGMGLKQYWDSWKTRFEYKPEAGAAGLNQAAMYRSQFKTLSDFYDFALANRSNPKETNKSFYQFTTKDGSNIEVLFDRILHTKDEHNLTAEELEEILNGLDNIIDASYKAGQKGGNDGIPVSLKVNTPNGWAGLEVEYLNNGRVLLITAFHDSETNIDNWIEKSGSRTRFAPGTANAAPAPALPGNRLSLENIQRALGIVKNPHVFEQRAFHGGPHRGIKKMSLQKIGSGLGTHVFGWGIYSTEDREAADFYRDETSSHDRNIIIQGKKYSFGKGDIAVWRDQEGRIFSSFSDKFIFDTLSEPDINNDVTKLLARLEELKSNSDNASNDFYFYDEAIDKVKNTSFPDFIDKYILNALSEADINDDVTKLLARLEELKSKSDSTSADFYDEAIAKVKNTEVENTHGQLYRLEIPDSDELLNWDKTLNDQPEKVKACLRKAGILGNSPLGEFYKAAAQKLGGKKNKINGFSKANDMYWDLTKKLGSQKAASEYLNSIGIPGLKNIAESQRSLKKPMYDRGKGYKYEFVIWDESRISVEETYYQSAGEKAETTDRLRPNETQKMAEAGGDDEAKPGEIYEQRAFHGGPHRGIKKMLLEKIGTGEGVQAFGWGIYSAGNRKTAEWYREILSDSDSVPFVSRTAEVEGKKYTLDRSYLWKNEQGEFLDEVDPDLEDFLGQLGWSGIDYDPAKLKERLEGKIEELRKNTGNSGVFSEFSPEEKKSYVDDLIADYERRIELADKTIVESVEEAPNTGQLYRLEIPESDELLDWDKPLSEQPERVKDVLDEAIKMATVQGDLIRKEITTGGQLYRRLRTKLVGAQAASEYLNSLGIPGLQYLDGNSRADGEGSHNFVIWDESRISVEETYYQFAGKGADSANWLRLMEAEDLDREGISNEEIRRKTGWFKGMEGRWRFEIPDNLDKIDLSGTREENGLQSAKLEDIYDNEMLYKAYSYLKKLKVVFMPSFKDGRWGEYDPGSDEIHINEGISDVDKRTTLLHEIQHAIQRSENFARGGSSNDLADLRLRALDARRHDIFANNPEFATLTKKIDDIRNEFEDVDLVTDEAHERINAIGEEIRQKYPDLEKQISDIILAEFDADRLRYSYDEYSRIAGEIEARDSASRAHLSDKELKLLEPELRDDAIIIFGGREVASYSMRESGLTYGERLYQDEQAWGEAVIKLEASGTPTGQHIKVMTTPLAFHLAGAKVLPVYMNDAKLFKILKDHPGMTWDLIKQLPGALADPIAVFSSKRAPDSLVAMLELTDENGATVVGALHLDVTQHSYTVNRLASVYGKDDTGANPPTPRNEWFTKELTSDRLRYLDTKKGSQWLNRTGLQLPAGTTIESLSQSVPTEAELVNMRETYDGYYQEEERVVKAATIFRDEETIIRLFQAADRSSFLHEMGHFFLESRKRLSQMEGVDERVREDWTAIVKWLGVDYIDFSKPLSKEDAKRWKNAQEKWAAAFEKYLMEGKAPSVALARAFRDFRKWLTDIYKAVKNIVYFDADGNWQTFEMSDEIRGVMDRLLASEEEIETSRAVRDSQALADELKKRGIPDDAAARYKDLVEQSAEKAKTKLFRKLMGELKEEKRAELAERRKEIKRRIAGEVWNMPEYKALRIFRRPREKGGLRISIADLADWLQNKISPSVELIETASSVDNNREVGAMANGEVEVLEERAAKVRGIKELSPVKIAAGAPMDKKQAETIARSFGVMENSHDKRRADFPTSSIGKIIGHKGFDVSTIMHSLKELFETSLPAWFEEELSKAGHKSHPNIVGYHHYVNKFTDGASEFFIRFTVNERKARQGKKGDNYLHSTAISDVTIYENDVPQQRIRDIDPGEARPASFTDRRLQEFFDSVNPVKSRQVDAEVHKLLNELPFGVVANDGLGIEEAAELAGYPAGEALLEDLKKAKVLPPQTAISRRVNEETAPLESAANDPEALKNEVEEALHGEDSSRPEWIAMEEQLLREAAKKAEKKISEEEGKEERKQEREEKREAKEQEKEERRREREESREAFRKANEEAKREQRAWAEDMAAKAQAAEETAKKILRGKSIRDATAVGRYLAAERRAAAKAYRLALDGQYAEAAEWKRRELIEHALAAEAMEIRENYEKGKRYLEKFWPNRKRLRGVVGEGHFAQIIGILERTGFNQEDMKAGDRVRLQEWAAEEAKRRGEELPIARWILDMDIRNESRASWNLSVEEFSDVVKAVQMLDHAGRNENKLLADARNENFRAAVEELMADVQAKHGPAKAKSTDPNLKTSGLFKSTLATLDRAETLLRMADAFEDQGKWWDTFYRPVQRAFEAELVKAKKAKADIEALFRKHFKDGKVFARFLNGKLDTGLIDPGTGKKLYWTGENLLAAMLNWGNQHNRERLVFGQALHGLGMEARFTDDQAYYDAYQTGKYVAEGMFARLATDEHWAFVQDVWDWLETFWPEIETLEREMTGAAPEKVEASPVRTAGGKVLRGGYYPVRFNSALDWKSFVTSEKENVKALYETQGARAMTRQGHTKERVERVLGRELLLSLSVIDEHAGDVIHDLTHRRAVRDLTKLIRDDDVRGALTHAIGADGFKQFNPWIQGLAAPARMTDATERFVSKLMGNTAAVQLGANVVSMIGQTVSLVPAGWKLGAVRAGRAVANAVTLRGWWNKEWRDAAFALSPELADRINGTDRSIRAALETARSDPKQRFWNEAKAALYLGLGWADMAISIPVWTAAYDQGLAMFKGDSQRAADHANYIVRTTNNTGAAKDLAQVQRGSPFKKLFTMYYSAFGSLYQMFREEAARAGKGGIPDKLRLAAFCFMMFTVQSALEDLLKGRSPWSEEEPPDKEEATKWILLNSVGSFTSMIPLVRDVFSGATRLKGRHIPNAALDAGGALKRGIESVSEAAWDAAWGRAEDVDVGKALKDIFDAGGYVASLPTTQLARWGRVFMRWVDDAPDFSPWEIVWPKRR